MLLKENWLDLLFKICVTKRRRNHAKSRVTTVATSRAEKEFHGNMPRIWLLVAACAYVMVSTKAFSPSPLRIPSHLRFGAKRSSRTPLQAGLFGIGGKKKVGVIGATGGVGRLAIAYLLQQGLA